MPDNEFVDRIRSTFDGGENDPYIAPSSAADAIGEDYPQWQTAVNNGLADYESATLMAAFGVDDPYQISEIGLSHSDSGWTLTIVNGDEIIEIDMQSDDLPFWVWDWLYDMADDFGWDWEISYE